MTRKKDLKRRVRERQAKTGESYTAALAQVRGPHIEAMPDATREAEAAGLWCSAVVSKKLRAAGDLAPLFTRIRELLEALGARTCGPLLRGKPAPIEIHEAVRLATEARRFLASVRGGFRGLSRDERLLALEWEGGVVLCTFVAFGTRKPLLVLGLLGDLPTLPQLSLMGIGR